MHKLITKYGLAAHLAFLAVAPLFLSAGAILWLALPAALWVLMEPSRIGGERLHEARWRIADGLRVDPLFWMLLFLVLAAGVRWANGGVGMAYDAEALRWSIAEPSFPLLPGSTDDAGANEFAAVVALTVIVLGCRHALGRSARQAFALLASLGSAICAAIWIWQFSQGDATMAARVLAGSEDAAYAGSVFGLYAILSVVAVISLFENRWYRVFAGVVLAVAGNLAGLFFFAPSPVIVLYLGVALLTYLYGFVYIRLRLGRTADFKTLVVLGFGVVAAGLCVCGMLPSARLAAKIDPVLDGTFFPMDFWEQRDILSGLCRRVWQAQPWLGGGLGSFPLQLQFGLASFDWDVIPALQKTPLNGFWMLLAERGVIGAFLLACPLALMLWTYFHRLVKGVLCGLPQPLCWTGLLALAAVVAESFVTVDFLMPAEMTALAAILAVSANSFPKERSHG